ncbi:MAG: penicillin-insensitive murein endopeptidase [Myxococcales bacterium]|nr:penicillin-insensitive murein endopeptidase [Myxococcales bacterium]
MRYLGLAGGVLSVMLIGTTVGVGLANPAKESDRGRARKGRRNPWASIATPSTGPARAIGGYSGGCLQGAKSLPLDGDGYQVMHPGRRRYYGHPELVDFIEDLSKATYAEAGGVLLIGDLAQPRGGRASGGHASHQSGLDVDIWFWHPPKAAKRKLSTAEREQTRARSILNGRTGEIRQRWKGPVSTALRLAASDPRVTRIFVHPIIKRELCRVADGDRSWLRQIRPWYGHDDHFHVRLACPKDSPDCEPQDPTPGGDGCGEELAWWFDEQAQADRRKARKRYQKKVVSGPRWPAACEPVLAAN